MADLIAATFPLSHSTEFGRALVCAGGPFEVVVEQIGGEPFAVFSNRHRHVLQLLLQGAAAAPDNEYLVDDERRLTYAQSVSAISALAQILVNEHGVRPGDRVGINAANSIEWVLGLWAAYAADAVPTLMNSFWSGPELEVALALSSPKVVLADERRAALVRATAPQVGVLELSPECYSRITSAGLPAPAVPQSDEDSVGMLMFTSGTTGRPKAVAHSHRAVVGTIACNRFNALVRAGAFPSAPPPPARVLISPPLFHLSAVYGAVLLFAVSGGTLVFRPGRFDEERTLAAISSERITLWLSVGSAAPRVATHPKHVDYDLSSLQSVVVGGAPLSPALKHALCEAFPSAMKAGGLRMGYTSSEGGSIVASIGGTEFAEYPESTGPLQDGMQMVVRDGDGNDLAVGEEGLIFVRSAYTMLEYYNDPAATREAYSAHRWLNMGDIGRVEDGRLIVNSRARDLIFVSAENVYPSEVENRLEEHPAVIETSVAGVDHPVTGQAVKAFVMVDPAAAVTEEELAAWCRGSLPPYKVPTQWSLRTEALPRNPAGKILRSALLEESSS